MKITTSMHYLAKRRTWRCGAPFAAAAGALALEACVASGHLARTPADTPVFDPIAFFDGSTEGQGSLQVIMRRPQLTLVEGQGIVTPDGAINLDQVVRRGNSPATHRTWHLYRSAPGRYTGTLSDARGPVTGEVTGDLLHLKFAMKGGLRAQQWLYLQPGGRTAANRMEVTKFGIRVAGLDETIVRQPK